MDRFKAVIFDMDGVIFDSERLYIDLWKEIAAKHKIPDIEETLYECIGVTKEVSRKIFRDRYGEDFLVETYEKQVSRRFHEIADQGRMSVKEGVGELLEFLKERKIPVAVASSTRTESVRKELASAGFLGYFQKIVGGDMVQKSKPAPDIFLEAARRLGAVMAADCIVIEDSHNGIRAAKAAGMTAVMVPDLLPSNEEMKKLADVVLPSLTDVKIYLQERLGQ